MIAILVSAAILVSVVVFLWMIPWHARRTFEHDVRPAPRCLTCAHPLHLKDACTECGCVWPRIPGNSRGSVECGDCHHVHRGRMYCNYRGLCTCTFIPGNSRADHG